MSLGELVAMASAEQVLDARAEAMLADRAAAGDAEAPEKLVRMTLRFAIDDANSQSRPRVCAEGSRA